MKIALLPLLALTGVLANPIANANAESQLTPLAKRATCTMISSGIEGCDWDPFHGQRRTQVPIGGTIHPTCQIGNGRNVGGTRVWDWIAEWGCWVSAHNTNVGCKNGIPACDGVGTDG